MISIKNISKKYNDLLLFEDVTIDISAKKTKIKGENGVGKRVLLKLIVGYSSPDSGGIWLGNKKIGEDTDFLEDAGVSINAPQFMKSWTGLENLEYLSKIKKTSNKNDILELVTLLDLSSAINKKYKTYSLGMQQKMRIIQALLDKPKYLILDEPFDALDKKSKKIVKELLNTYISKTKDSQILYTSHSEVDDDFADEIIEIKDNKIYKIK